MDKRIKPDNGSALYFSDAGYFIYDGQTGEYSTNPTDKAAGVLGTLILKGVKAHEVLCGYGLKQRLPGEVREVRNDDATAVIGAVATSHQILYEALVAFDHLPSRDMTSNEKSLASRLGNDLYALVQELAYEGVLGPEDQMGR